jgi:hypothetical protein
MKEIIVIDGIKTELQSADLDGDGVTGEVETVVQKTAEDIQPIFQPTETGESIKELFRSDIDPYTRFSDTDQRANLHEMEIPSVLAMDALASLKCLPIRVQAVTMLKKRLSISKNARGRDDIVNIMSGQREHEEAKSGSFGSKVKSFFGMGGNK